MAVRTISTKLAVEGEAEYKKSIAACNGELSTLKSSLGLVEAAFKGNANSMEALKEKGAALEAIYKKQTEKITTLEDALKNAQNAQAKYSDRVAEAEANVSKYEKALADLKDSTGDTSEEQAALTTELEKWKTELSNAQAGQEAAARGVQGWQRQLNNANAELYNLDDEIQKNKKYLAEAEKSTDGCAKSIDEYGNEVKDTSGAIDQLAGVLAAAGVAKGIKEIAESLLECSEAAAEFETSIAKVATIADTSTISLDQIRAQIIKLSGDMGVSASAIAEATYSAISASVDTASAVEFVEKATKLAAGGFTEAETAVDVLTTAINAYGLSVQDTEKISDILITTQNKGKTTVDALAQSVGKVIPLAAAYGVEMDNLGAAYAVLTANGVATAEAGTYLKAMLNELGDSGSTVAGVLQEETGKSFAALMAGGASLGDVLAILGEGVDGNATAFNELWSSTEAGVGALSIFNKGADEYNSVLEEMQKSAGATSQAYDTMADTTEVAQRRMTTAAENLKVAIGTQLNPALEKLYDTGADAFTWATDFVEENPWIVSALVAVGSGIATLTVGVTLAANAANIATVATTALNAVMSANPAFLVAAGVTALVAAIGTFIFTMGSADEETKAFTESLQQSKEAYDELSSSMAEEQDATAANAAALAELLEVEEKSALQKDLIAEKVAALNEAVPNLGLAYDAEKDSLEGLTAAELESMVQRAAAQEEYEAQVTRLGELYTEQKQIEAELQEAQQALNEAQETGAGNTRTLQNNIDELTAAQEENAAQIAELEEASADYAEQQAQAAEKTATMETRVEDLITRMNDLETAYEEAHQKAVESIEGQLGLFNELDGSAKTSIGSLIETLKGQVEYMDTYAANIKKAMEMGVDEGLVKKLSDGSEESAQILAAIVQGGEEDIAALNEQLAKVEEGKNAFGDTVAEMETDFSEKMENLVKELDDAIQDMNLSDDAYEIGENNIQGLIDGTASKRRELINTYAEMGRAAMNAYRKEVAQASPSKKFAEIGRYDVEGIIGGAESEKAHLAATYEDVARTALDSMRKAIPSNTEEPPASTIADKQTAAIVAAVSSREGGDTIFQIYVDEMNVRDDQDVQRVAEELYYMTEREKRSRGGGSL